MIRDGLVRIARTDRPAYVDGAPPAEEPTDDVTDARHRRRRGR